MSTPRRCQTKVFLTRQATSPLQALQRAYTSELHGTLFVKLFKLKPVDATASRIKRLTAGSRARSAVSSKFSDLRTCVTTMSSRRPGIASCASARLAGVLPVVMVPLGAVMAVCVA